ncbi:MAG TPA: hypothetical protein VFA70_00505 [Dehalococcoidia bacterium]|jgi:hypothetical protein|nr:hypothetical protein [Dehalococcoidia bacterium]
MTYAVWTTCRHCRLPYALRHDSPPAGHACSVASGCFVIMPFRRCPDCDATVHERCPEGVPSVCPAAVTTA